LERQIEEDHRRRGLTQEEIAAEWAAVRCGSRRVVHRVQRATQK
jgi:hypothetical protein